MTREKVYDEHYFERWYRRSSVGVGQREFVARKVRLAGSAAESLLGRPIESVLDVGCGEAPWRAHLRKLRPGVHYDGMDSSVSAVKRFGRTRNIRLGAVGDLGKMGFRGPYDLVVCSDVLHYVADDEVKRGRALLEAVLVALDAVFARERLDERQPTAQSVHGREPALHLVVGDVVQHVGAHHEVV
ncbi:MAG: methyltransferase, partial [bacterium]